MDEQRNVLLAYMPFGLIQTAPLGLSLLKAALTRQNVACDIRYFNIEFVDQCLDGSVRDRTLLYNRLTRRYQLTFAAEARVAELLFGTDPERLGVIAPHVARAEPDERALLGVLPARFEQFLEHCLQSVDWRRYRVLGLSSVFLGMTVPSLLLAREVKRRFPHVVTVLGGPNTEGPMGEVLLRRCQSLDYVLRGEADETLPLLVDAILAGRPPGAIPGLVQRAADGISACPMRPIDQMDRLPYPDFDDFMAATKRCSFAARYQTKLQLPFESSRGCWWGQKSHCKFCGINALGMGYRSKSHDRMLEEIEWLTTRYEPDTLVAADAILDSGYFGTLLPRLKNRRNRIGLSYEVKANLSRAQMEEIRDAGIVEILPGIETFSTRLLKLMKKGASSFDNLMCLRLAEECGIKVSWYHMCGLPRETLADYEQDIATIRRIPHLQPPREIARFTLQRFTPYLQDATAEGLGQVRPMAEYRAVFPFTDAELSDLAYHFEFEFTDGRDATLTATIESSLGDAVAAWKSRYGQVALDIFHAEGGAVIIDTRQPQALVYLLDQFAARLYACLDRPHTAQTLNRRLAETAELAGLCAGASSLLPEATYLQGALGAKLLQLTGPRLEPSSAGPAFEETAVQAWLESLVAQELLHEEGGRCLALAVPRARAAFESRYGREAAAMAAS